VVKLFCETLQTSRWYFHWRGDKGKALEETDIGQEQYSFESTFFVVFKLLDQSHGRSCVWSNVAYLGTYCDSERKKETWYFVSYIPPDQPILRHVPSDLKRFMRYRAFIEHKNYISSFFRKTQKLALKGSPENSKFQEFAPSRVWDPSHGLCTTVYKNSVSATVSEEIISQFPMGFPRM